MEWFCDLPFDLIRLLILQYLDPKTRLSMIYTCSRLHKTFFTLPWQRKWLLLGKEPPNLNDGVIHPRFKKCEKCEACMYDWSFKQHKCYSAKIDYTYCNWCMSKILPQVAHDLSDCLQSKNARCNECATWHPPYNECPFKLLGCCEKIHNNAKHHRRCEFQKCEICGSGELICPNVVPRCNRHAFYECRGCSMLVDPSLPDTHVCDLLVDRLSVFSHCDLKPISHQVFLGTRYTTAYLYVANVYKIPPLLAYAEAEVVLFSEEEIGQFDLTTLVRFVRDNPCVETHDLFPKTFCCKCLTTVQHDLKWCTCGKVMFCSNACRTLAWKEHSKWCGRK